MQIETSARFKREYKRLVRKFPSLKDELEKLIDDLDNNPELGTPIGMNCYKIRLPIASKGVGKRGGARVITFVRLTKEEINLLTIYDKNEISDISDKEILSIIKDVT
jgi:hypothetical protein